MLEISILLRSRDRKTVSRKATKADGMAWKTWLRHRDPADFYDLPASRRQVHVVSRSVLLAA